MDESTPAFAIAVAAELAGMHPQTLRQYDRLGLVSPTRTSGRSRRYCMRDVMQAKVNEGVIADKHLDLFQYTETPEETWNVIKEFHGVDG